MTVDAQSAPHSDVPLISIVTVCRNAAGTIGKAIESVVGCEYPNLEYIVIDGGSTDETLSIVNRYRSRVNTLVSEPDRGIADAMNKGIALSQGEFHFLLHADDTLLPNSIGALVPAITPQAMVVSGCVDVMQGERPIRRYRPEPAKLLYKMSLPHMGCIVRKSAWQTAGGYDERRRIAMDHLLMLRILKRYGLGAFEVVDDVIAQYQVGGLSDLHLYAGFREVRLNLLEEGYGRLRADMTCAILYAKGFLGRQLLYGSNK
jgi:glycosyltransferase involved in cell wall biosynthesis